MLKIQLSKKVIAMACVFVLALAMVAISSVQARTQNNAVKAHVGVPSPGQGTPQGENLATTKHVLNGTYYDSNNSSQIISGCSTTDCLSTPAPIFTESIPCSGATGTKCTYEVNIAAQTFVNFPGDEGLYQFLIDGAAPTGGGTDSSGFYSWEVDGATGWYTSAYFVTSQVQNTSTNQSHSIAVNVACLDVNLNGGCAAFIAFRSLTVRVLKP